MKLLIVGAGGYLGSELTRHAEPSFAVLGTSSTCRSKHAHLDLLSVDRFDFRVIDGETILLVAAAISAPDVCAQEHDRAWAVNVAGTSLLISKAMERGGRVVFFSSDTVYGERDGAFDELGPCNPSGPYAVMKHEVEQRFAGAPLFKAIRLSFVFSRDDKFTRYLSGCAERGDEAEVFHPFSRSVIHRDDVVAGTLALAKRWEEVPERVINLGGPQVLSRVEFAECLRDVCFHDLRFRVTEPDPEFFKSRPRTIAMSSPILPRLLGRQPRTLCEAARIEFGSGGTAGAVA